MVRQKSIVVKPDNENGTKIMTTEKIESGRV